VEKAVQEVNDALAQDRQIEAQAHIGTCENPARVRALISVDDVLSKKQKASGRKKGSPPPKKKERVKNTVAHILAWKGRNLHADDPHHPTYDDRFVGFSALE
jgi:hypothetical protein